MNALNYTFTFVIIVKLFFILKIMGPKQTKFQVIPVYKNSNSLCASEKMESRTWKTGELGKSSVTKMFLHDTLTIL